MVPVLITGNLREQLTYPRPMAEYPESIDTLDANLQSILASLHLDHLISIFPLNESFPMTTWNTLSNGEKQRLQFARLFLWQPILAFLEESTLGIDPTLEKFIYLECRRRKIQLVAVDNRTEALREYFDKRLHFDKDRSYIITNL